MDQPTLTTGDQAAVRHEPVRLSRDDANLLFDIRWSADECGYFDRRKYMRSRLYLLHELELAVPAGGDGHGGDFTWLLTERGRLCTVSIDHVSRPVPAAPANPMSLDEWAR